MVIRVLGKRVGGWGLGISDDWLRCGWGGMDRGMRGDERK